MSEPKKPLELTIYRRCACGPDCKVYAHPDLEGPDIFEGFSPWLISAKHKRLTDAELAAEVWHAAYECWMLPAVCRRQSAQPELNRRQLILERFATHPHYDEEQA